MADPVLPRYGESSLAEVLPGTLAALGIPAADPLRLADMLDGVRRVAVLLVDGLGWHLLPMAAPFAPTLAAAAGSPSARELTAPFPSTTPTSLVSLGTGAPPGAHGVIGFTLNIPGTDRVLHHLNWTDDPDPTVWQPIDTQFDRAAAAGVTVTVVSRPEFAGSGLSVAAYRGAQYRGAETADDLAAQMLAGLGAAAPSLVYGYHPDLDRVGHLCGVDSEPWRQAVADVDRLVRLVAERLPADAALLVTADHGMLDVPPDQRVDIDADAGLRDGIAVVAGEPRVRYLHTVPGARDDVIAVWRARLGAAGWVGSRDEAVAGGWFGPVAPKFLARVGDVVVVCRDPCAVVASRTEPELTAKLVAYHGSDTRVEMDVPLLVIPPG